MAKRKTHTIYLLTINGVPYIGQTGNFRRRKRDHIVKLKGGYHENAHLQHAFNKYGSSTLKFAILESCPASRVNELETEWIRIYDSYKNGFNQCMYDDGTIGKPCTWNGIEYPSLSSAAAACGINGTSMHRRLKKGYTCDDDLKVKRGRLNKNKKCRASSENTKKEKRVAIPVEWNGIKYPSKAKVCKVLGISYGALDARLKRGYRCDADMQRHMTMLHGCDVVWNGQVYSSIDAAADALNIHRNTVYRRIRKGWVCDTDIAHGNAKLAPAPDESEDV